MQMDMQVYLSAEVCEDSDPTSCETPFRFVKESGDEETGAVYSADFQTAFGGALNNYSKWN